MSEKDVAVEGAYWGGWCIDDDWSDERCNKWASSIDSSADRQSGRSDLLYLRITGCQWVLYIYSSCNVNVYPFSCGATGNGIEFQLLIVLNVIYLARPYSALRRIFSAQLTSGFDTDLAIKSQALSPHRRLEPESPIRWFATYGRYIWKLDKYATTALYSGAFVLPPVWFQDRL